MIQTPITLGPIADREQLLQVLTELQAVLHTRIAFEEPEQMVGGWRVQGMLWTLTVEERAERDALAARISRIYRVRKPPSEDE